MPHEPHTDFPFDEVFERLDGQNQETKDRAAEALASVVKWIIGPRLNRKDERSISIRAIALAWILNPELFSGMSLREIARQIGTSRSNLSKHAADFTRLFGVQSRGQAHGWNRKPRSEAQANKARASRNQSSRRRLVSDNEAV